MLTKIAWRNIWRSRNRSLIIIASVTIGLWAGIFLIAFYNGMIEQRVTSAIESEVSHLQLHHPDFRDDYDIRFLLKDGKNILEQIQTSDNVKAAAGRIIIKGMIASAAGSSGITVNGVMPDEEDQVTGLKEKIIDGAYFDPQKHNEILIGEKLLLKLKLKIRNKAIITFQDKDGNIASGAFRVVGIYKTVNGPYDESNVFIRVDDAASLAGIGSELNEIAVLLKSSKLLIGTQVNWQKAYPATEVLNWMELSPEVGLTVSVGDQMVFIFMGIILLALVFGIINTMMMAVLERTREIGMLLALGMNKLKVFGMIVLETIFLVLAGCPSGILFALVTIAITKRTGITFKKFSDVYSSFGYSDVIYPELTARAFGMIMIMVVTAAVLSSLLPARRALRLNPAESIRK